MSRLSNTRSGALWRHLSFALTNSKLERETYADEVAKLYIARTPPHERGLLFHEHAPNSDPYKVFSANRQLVFRMLDPDGPVRAPMELEEAAVLALPQPFRRECLRELAGRYGLLAAPIPAAGDDAPALASSCGEFAREFGECLLALAGTIGDGHLDPSDVARSPAAIDELDGLIAHAASLRALHVANIEAGGQQFEPVQVLQVRMPPRGAHGVVTAVENSGGTVSEFPKRAGQEL